MQLGNNIRHLVGINLTAQDMADHYQSEAKRLAACATRAERQRLTIQAQEIRERVAICKQYVQDYKEQLAGR